MNEWLSQSGLRHLSYRVRNHFSRQTSSLCGESQRGTRLPLGLTPALLTLLWDLSPRLCSGGGAYRDTPTQKGVFLTQDEFLGRAAWQDRGAGRPALDSHLTVLGAQSQDRKVEGGRQEPSVACSGGSRSLSRAANSSTSHVWFMRRLQAVTSQEPHHSL